MSDIPVTKSSLPLFKEYVDEISDIWDSHWLTNMGSKHEKLTSMLEEYLHTPYVSLFTNGHLALENAIESFGLAGEVITTPFTFASTTHAIVRNNLIPVFCDIDPETFTLDPNKLEQLITERTSAIIPVHVYGTVCDTEEIERIAKKHNLKVIYDAAHAFGVEVKGRGIGNFGDASMFSFHATKVFNTIEGGCVTFQDAQLKERLSQLKNFGITGPETVEFVGGNAKMNEFQAAMGICNLHHLKDEISKREKIVNIYRERLEGIPGLKLMAVQEGVKPNYAYFPVVFEGEGWDRDEVVAQLGKHNIFVRKYFYPLVSDYACYSHLENSTETPIAKKIASQVITLPLYADLSLEAAEHICQLIQDLYYTKSKNTQAHMGTTL
ncbi:dTDP-4-amino-4,6-dideoxygalactose transaminase [Alkalibacterium subtropicum]|uniref:dTDP-4-amino-4,6-dideoxygalactose transaminase n=1 Tax=Alkalibacterium subtropicum TaxID=753702 RepID=A0A1I1K8V3_9LACT|nr:DegT/DnrJ/EryC1/StrS family aminotransferase [Alkalibacterium subtropicum]SFC56985.1 dTDP-4-amino-4,6-dideoxygalactose transaminase [Alkalibacterium subtropicum]